MLAYNTELLDHTEVLLHAKRWHKNKRISDMSYAAVKNKYTDILYTPNFFIRIGLFIFTAISASAANGFIMLFTGFYNGSEVSFEYGLHFIIHGAIMLFVLEFLIRKKKIYKAGIDDALLYMSLSSIITGICTMMFSTHRSIDNTLLLFSLITLPILVAATMRYSDMLTAALAFICAFLIFFILISKIGEMAKYLMPFLVMLFSTLCYLQIVKLRQKENLRFWDSSLKIIELSSLLLFYMAGNYFIIRTLLKELFSSGVHPGEDIPMAIIFYAFTALIPLVYIFFGLKNKNRLLLQMGLILVAASVITFKYYFSLGHPEITMTIGGIIMIVVAWLSTNYFKTPKFGITYVEDKEEKALGTLDAEALIIAQTFSGSQQQNNNPELGGGKFGGGGADSSF